MQRQMNSRKKAQKNAKKTKGELRGGTGRFIDEPPSRSWPANLTKRPSQREPPSTISAPSIFLRFSRLFAAISAFVLTFALLRPMEAVAVD